MTAAQFEISIDGVPRTYRDQKDIALLAVKVKDLKTGKEIVVTFKSGQQ